MRTLLNYLFGGNQAVPADSINYSSLNNDVPVATIDVLEKQEPSDGKAIPEILLDGLDEPLDTVHLTKDEFTNIKKLEYYKGLKLGILSSGIAFGIIIIIIVTSVVLACK